LQIRLVHEPQVDEHTLLLAAQLQQQIRSDPTIKQAAQDALLEEKGKKSWAVFANSIKVDQAKDRNKSGDKLAQFAKDRKGNTKNVDKWAAIALIVRGYRLV